MIFELSKTEKSLLVSMSKGISKILIFKCGGYPSVVSFKLKNDNTVTIGAKGKDIAPRFEVFPIIVTEDVINSTPEHVIDFDNNDQHFKIDILQKSEWIVPSSQDEKESMFGNSTGATTQYEGKITDIPHNAINQTTLHAGIELKNKGGWKFVVASSLSPFLLYVSDCEFSESFDQSIYEHKLLNEG